MVTHFSLCSYTLYESWHMATLYRKVSLVPRPSPDLGYLEISEVYSVIAVNQRYLTIYSLKFDHDHLIVVNSLDSMLQLIRGSCRLAK